MVMLSFSSLYHFHMSFGYYGAPNLPKLAKILQKFNFIVDNDVITRRGLMQFRQNFQESLQIGKN